MRALLLLFLLPALAYGICPGERKPYFIIGAGYKIDEADWMMRGEKHVRVDKGHPIAAVIEAGCEFGRFRVSLLHNSQWFEGWPVDNTSEYHNTQILFSIRFN